MNLNFILYKIKLQKNNEITMKFMREMTFDPSG